MATVAGGSGARRKILNSPVRPHKAVNSCLIREIQPYARVLTVLHIKTRTTSKELLTGKQAGGRWCEGGLGTARSATKAAGKKVLDNSSRCAGRNSHQQKGRNDWAAVAGKMKTTEGVGAVSSRQSWFPGPTRQQSRGCCCWSLYGDGGWRRLPLQ